MSLDDVPEAGTQLDFSGYVADHFQPSGMMRDLHLVDVGQVGRTLRVVFDGIPDIREGRFGVRIHTPARVGDERWRDFPVGDDEPEAEWLKMAMILELMEIYDTTAQSAETPADENGVIWLS